MALAYADHASSGPLRVWVAAERLQARTSLGRTATTAAVRRLREAGWLTLTSAGVRGSTARYALTTPGIARELEHDQVDDVDEHQAHEPRQVSPRDELLSPRDELVSAGDPDPLPHPPTTPLAVVEDVARERRAGWTPDDVRRELAAQDFTGARTPGLLSYRLTALAQSRTAPAPEPRTAARPTSTTRALFPEHDEAAASRTTAAAESATAVRAATFPFMTLAAAHVVAHVAFVPRPETTGQADTEQTSASAGQANGQTGDERVAGQGTAHAGHPTPADGVRVAGETTDSPPADTPDVRTDAGSRPIGRTSARGRVAAHRADIVRLARTTTQSGCAIAAELGLDKTALCAIVRDVRTDARMMPLPVAGVSP